MKALITGVQGFVGKYLANHLLAQDIEVWGTSRKESPVLFLENGPVTIIKNDLENTAQILELLKEIQPDYIFHLAGQSNVQKSWEDKAGTFYANVNKTIYLLDACVEYQKIKPEMRLLTIGSSEEYGKVEPYELPIKETTPLRPMSPYGASKAAVSMLVQQYFKAHGLNVIHARPFNHIGPGQADGFVTTDFAKQIVAIEKNDKEPIITVGDLSSKRDFTNVLNIAEAYLKLVQRGIFGQIYNICSGIPISIQTVLEKIVSFAPKKIDVKIDRKLFRPIEFKEYYGSSEKIKLDTDWEAKISLDESLEQIYLHLKSKDFY